MKSILLKSVLNILYKFLGCVYMHIYDTLITKSVLFSKLFSNICLIYNILKIISWSKFSPKSFTLFSKKKHFKYFDVFFISTCIFLMTNVEHLFMYLFAIHLFSLLKSMQIFHQYFINLFVLFLSSNYYCILDMSSYHICVLGILPFRHSCLPIFLTVFWKKKILIIDEFQIIFFFSFMFHFLYSIWEVYLKGAKVLIYFLLEILIILAPTFRSMIHIKLINTLFVVKFVFYKNIISRPCDKKIFFPRWIFLTPLSKSNWTYFYRSVSWLLIMFH